MTGCWNDRWDEVPVTLYTGKQLQQAEEKRRQKLEKRTHGRSERSISDAVAQLRRLIDMPERRDLMVELVWTLLPDGEVGRELHEVGDHFTLDRSMEDFRMGRILCLWHEGLQLSTVDKGSRYKLWQNVREDQLVEVVRRFQLLPGQILFLIDQFTATVD